MDIVDIDNDNILTATYERIRDIRAREIPAGVPGECDLCGEHSGRLVRGACAPCRDKYQPEEL